ncbi:uncharacterized protein [Diadema antillarum]|uniref:uncharacterized protein n=1 Tax=Diadema antillarum TaxID=105358 RepID=UPI003A874E3A
MNRMSAMDVMETISGVMTTIQDFLKKNKKWRRIPPVHIRIKRCVEGNSLEPCLEPFVHAYLYITPISGCIVRDDYVCLAECFDSALAKIQKILESHNPAEIKDVEDIFLQQASKAEQIAVGNITHVVEMKKGKVCMRKCCPLSSADYLPFHLHFIIEALDAIIAHLENAQQSSLPSGGCPFQVIANILKQKCSPYALKSFGGFETSIKSKALKKILKSYDKLFVVSSMGVTLKEGIPQMAHEMVEANFCRALSKVEHMLRGSPGFCEELFAEAQRRYSDAVHSTLGRNVNDFIQTLKSQSKTFHVIKHQNKHFILLRETVHTQTNPLLSGINKVKNFITKGCDANGKFAFSELVKKCSGLTKDEVFFIGKNAQLIKTFLNSHPDQFIVEEQTVSVEPNAPSLPAGLAKYPSTCLPEWPSGPLVYQVKTPTQNSLASPASENSPPLPASTLTSQQNGGEDVVGDHPDITSFMQSLVSSDAGEDTRRADVSNDSTSGQRWGNSTRIRPSRKSFPGECTVTIVKDPSSFKRITSEKVSQYDRPIIAVVSSDRWLVLHFWEGDVFAIDVGALSPLTKGDLSGSVGKIAGGLLENVNTWSIIGVVGDLLRNKSILKVVRGAVALSVDLQQLAGLNLTKVFDVMIADNIIRQQRRPVSIEELQELYEVTPCSEVKVVWENSKSVVSSELVDTKGRMKEGAIQQLRELVTQSSCLIPDLYQVMLSMMSADMLLKLSKRCEVAVKTKKAKDSSSQSSGKKSSTCQTSDIFSIPGTFPPSMTNGCIPDTMATGVRHHPMDGVEGLGGEEEEEGLHGFPIQMSSRERVAVGQSVRSKRSLAHDGEQGSSGGVPAVGRDDHQQSPRTNAPVAEREITSTPVWMQPMILQYQGDGKPIYVHPLSELASVPINPCQVTEELEDAFLEMVKTDVQKFVGVFDGMIKASLERLTEKDPQYALENLAEVVLDIGRKPLAR